MAKDLVDSAASSLLRETLAILQGKGLSEHKVADAIDHLKLGVMARKRAMRRQSGRPVVVNKPAPDMVQTVKEATATPAVNPKTNGPTQTPVPQTDKAAPKS